MDPVEAAAGVMAIETAADKVEAAVATVTKMIAATKTSTVADAEEAAVAVTEPEEDEDEAESQMYLTDTIPMKNSRL